MERLPTFLFAIVILEDSMIAEGQEPVTLSGNPLQGVIDFHVHSGPDSFTRSVTNFEIARPAKKSGMRAIVLKTISGPRPTERGWQSDSRACGATAGLCSTEPSAV